MQMLSIRHTLSSERDEALSKAHTFMAAAEKENRELTDEERNSVQSHLDAAKAIKARIDQLTGDDEMRAQIEAFQNANAREQRAVIDQRAAPGHQTQRAMQSLGEQLVSSATYRDGIRGKARPRGWSSGTVELDMHATLLDSSGGSGGALRVPDYQASIRPKLFPRLVIADLIASGTTDSSAIIYMEETASVNGAAAVAEGAAKPESTLVFAQKTDLVKKIATWLPVTDEMLDDVPQLRSYIDARLVVFVQQEEEDQILNGDGVGPNLTGIRNRVGLAADVVHTAPDNNMDSILKQATAIATTSYVFPDAVVMNPLNWQTIMLTKNQNGDYAAGGPFAATMVQSLWGFRVVVTPAIPAGVALVGAFSTAAQIFRKGGIAVEAANTHADYFIRNLTAIRAEERLALAVYTPGAFGEVTGLA